MNIYVCIWEENIFPLATDQIRFVMPNVSAELCVFLGDGVQLLAFGGLFSAHLRFFFFFGGICHTYYGLITILSIGFVRNFAEITHSPSKFRGPWNLEHHSFIILMSVEAIGESSGVCVTYTHAQANKFPFACQLDEFW